MPGIFEPDVRDGGEDPREGLAYALASFVARAGGTLEDAIVSHEVHQGTDVVTVPAGIKECFQILDRHHHLLAASTRVRRSAPAGRPSDGDRSTGRSHGGGVESIPHTTGNRGTGHTLYSVGTESTWIHPQGDQRERRAGGASPCRV